MYQTKAIITQVGTRDGCGVYYSVIHVMFILLCCNLIVLLFIILIILGGQTGWMRHTYGWSTSEKHK
jgi:hypothetical protein